MTADFGADAVTLQVFGNAVKGLANELQVAMIRAAYSPIIKEMFDCSAAILTVDGEYLAMADGIPLQLGVLSTVTRNVAASGLPLREGDVILTNDPWLGSPHLNDFLTVAPVVVDGEIVAFVTTLMHHADVGGKTPGSMPADATEMFQEGIRCPAAKVIDSHSTNSTLLDLLVVNSRLPVSMRGDLEAQLAGTVTGVKRLQGLVTAQGAGEFHRVSRLFLDYCEELVRLELQDLRPGTYSASRALELRSVADDPPRFVNIAAETTVSDDRRIDIDLSRSDEQIAAPFNVVLSNSRSAALVALRAFIPAEVPINAGLERHVRVTCEPGRVTNPTLPAPVGARAALAALVHETMLATLSQAHAVTHAASSSGGTTMPYVWAHRSGILIDNTITGGVGATAEGPGACVADNSVTNALGYPTEIIEQDHPVILEEVSVRRGSGGEGLHAGGDGMIRRVRFLEAGRLSLRGHRTVAGPAGADGGGSGATARFTLVRDDKAIDLAPQATDFETKPGDVLVILTPGGGGYGVATTTRAEKETEQ
jgi:N-methylhydantoinase B